MVWLDRETVVPGGDLTIARHNREELRKTHPPTAWCVVRYEVDESPPAVVIQISSQRRHRAVLARRHNAQFLLGHPVTGRVDPEGFGVAIDGDGGGQIGPGEMHCGTILTGEAAGEVT